MFDCGWVADSARPDVGGGSGGHAGGWNAGSSNVATSPNAATSPGTLSNSYCRSLGGGTFRSDGFVFQTLTSDQGDASGWGAWRLVVVDRSAD